MSESDPMRSGHISKVVHATPESVYAYAADIENLSQWASGLAGSPVATHGDELVAQSPMGEVTVRFVERNSLGVLDHDVVLPDGTTVNNPLRVLAHPDGAEVVFTVRQLEMTDEEFDRDARTVAADLARLKSIVESSDSGSQ